MGKSSSIFGISVAGTVLTLLAVTAAPSQEPHVSPSDYRPLLDPETNRKIDAGLHRPNSKVAIRIPIRNPTAKTITLHGSQTTCGCTKVSLVPEKIPSNGNGFITVDIAIGGLEGDYGYKVRALTRPLDSIGTPIIYADEFQISLQVREECSFFGSRPLLSTSSNQYLTPFTIRAVNYGNMQWVKPKAQLTSIKTPCAVTSSGVSIDGATRQVLTVIIDRAAFSREILAKSPVPDRSMLELSATDDASNDSMQRVIGRLDIRIYAERPIEIYPAAVNWNQQSPANLVLIVVTRSGKQTLETHDFNVTFAKHALNAAYDEIRPGWGKLTIRGEEIDVRSVGQPELSIAIPSLNFVQRVRMHVPKQ